MIRTERIAFVSTSCAMRSPRCVKKPGSPIWSFGFIAVDELRQWRDEKRPHLLIDVREPGEYATSRIEGAQLIPLRQLQSHVKDLPKGQTIVVHCQSGGRSAIAVAMLKVQGFDARNLSGGIKAWLRTEKS